MVNRSLATPLHLACRNNREKVVKFLIGCGADVNLKDEHGQTPLLLCCIHENQDILQMLIEASISGQLTEPLEVDLPNHQGLTPLNCAAIQGNYFMVKLLISRGGANVDQTSPKGCTPLIYAGRGGFSKVVEFLIQKQASPFKQDNGGGTVFHHAIEKGQTQVLESMLALGVDVYTAIEIADNSGRTPLYEAIEDLNDSNIDKKLELIDILTRKKSQNGFEVNTNVVNYNGQTPLFIAARSGYFEIVNALVEAGAQADLNNGEFVKPEDDNEQEEFETLQERNFEQAFKNSMTPLHIASVLGFSDIAIYLATDCGADVNLKTRSQGYTVLHLCVLANKPEMIIQFLTKTEANPLIEDKQGRTLLDMIFQYMPSYLEIFQQILETLQIQTHENNVQSQFQDDRQITGIKTNEEINQFYYIKEECDMEKQIQNDRQLNMDLQTENEILEEGAGITDPRIEKAYGFKIALCIASQNWQYKEQALKFALRHTEKYLQKSEINALTMNTSLVEIIDASMFAVSLTCREKVVKVSNISIQLFNLVVQSQRIIREKVANQRVIQMIKSEDLILKFLVHSEQSNTRVIQKIHEALLDLAYQPYFGEDLITKALYNQIKQLKRGQNHKGLMAHLALLFKLVNSFDVNPSVNFSIDESSEESKALTKQNILEVVLPSVTHSKDDIRLAAIKILTEVQKKTKQITLLDLEVIPEKIKDTLWEKLQEYALTENENPVQEKKNRINVVNLEIAEQKQQDNGILTEQALSRFKSLIFEKGTHKDWTQREIALQAIQDCFNLEIQGCSEVYEEEFVSKCAQILQASLDENNIQIYLIAVETVLQFILKLQSSETIVDILPNLLQSVVLHTTDTNTRVRKQSVEVISQVWDVQLHKKSTQTMSQVIANVLCEQSLNEKAIIGRLGLLIKKAISIEQSQDLSKKPLHLILGKDYEQLAQFACQWCSHKNTKVRQCALKLAIEICRLNQIDPRGLPFKQRIVNFILGLRSSIRTPLIKKINEACHEANPTQPQYLNEQEIELSLVTKVNRNINLEVLKVNQVNSTDRQTELPSITGESKLPSVIPQITGFSPQIVLPHSEPLSDLQKQQSESLIELFGLDLITCFYSQTWSSRLIAIQKLQEQLHQLDPNRRDAMSAEINKNNLPPEISFKTLLKIFEDGLKDPVLKNYITILELMQDALPIYLRYLRPEQIKRELTPLIQVVINKTSDLKQKIREASINYCLYLTHQVDIGVEPLVNLVLGELDQLQWEKQGTATSQFGNSNMIVSCLNMLAQFQSQNTFIKETSNYYTSYVNQINKALKHSNPQVRKEGESLFKIMYASFQDSLLKEIKDQKPQLITKLTTEILKEYNDKQKSAEKGQLMLNTNQISQQIENDKLIQGKTNDDYLSSALLKNLMKGNEDKLEQLKLPNPQKRLIAIVEIKKLIQQKLSQITSKSESVRELVDPLSMLLRHLLRDDNNEVYLEAVGLLKFIVGNIAQHLSSLDVHLMIGQFIGLLIQSQNTNMRARLASDKVIIYFAKHTNIGSLIVSKEILKNIERLNKIAFIKSSVKSEVQSIQEKKQILTRYYGILSMLIQQFSIVLCYQPSFYQQFLEVLADSLSKCNTEEPLLKQVCSQLVVQFHQIDSKLLDQGVQMLDFTKKASLKKIIIELENSQQKGGVIDQKQSTKKSTGSPDVSFRDTHQSFSSLNSRGTIMSPSHNMNRMASIGNQRRIELNSTTFKENSQPGMIISSNTTDNWQPRIGGVNQVDQSQTGVGWLERRQAETLNSSNLPPIDSSNNKTARRRQLGQGYIGGVSTSNKAAGFNRNEIIMNGEQSYKREILEISTQVSVQNGVINNILNSTTKQTINKEQQDSKEVPFYVPTQSRQTYIKKQDSYQPSILTRLNNKEIVGAPLILSNVNGYENGGLKFTAMNNSSVSGIDQKTKEQNLGEKTVSRSRHQLY